MCVPIVENKSAIAAFKLWLETAYKLVADALEEGVKMTRLDTKLKTGMIRVWILQLRRKEQQESMKLP